MTQEGPSMITKGSKKGTVRFCFQPEGKCGKVALVSDFTDWKPKAMRKQKSGLFVTQAPLGAGRYEYKFIVDGDWRLDPDNDTMAMNCYGTFNSVAIVD